MLGAAMLFVPAAVASAQAPLDRDAGYITDEANVLSAAEESLREERRRTLASDQYLLAIATEGRTLVISAEYGGGGASDAPAASGGRSCRFVRPVRTRAAVMYDVEPSGSAPAESTASPDAGPRFVGVGWILVRLGQVLLAVPAQQLVGIIPQQLLRQQLLAHQPLPGRTGGRRF